MKGIAALIAGAALCVGWTMGGCTTVLGIESDRHVAASDRGDGGAVPVQDSGSNATTAPPGWACIDDPAPTPSPNPVQVKFFINDVSTASSTDFSGKPIPFAALRACGTLDVTCANPLGSTTADDGGTAVITVPSSFRGFYELTAPGYSPGILARPPQIRDEATQQGVADLTLISLGGQLAGVTADPALGIAIVSVIDCELAPAPGMLIDVGDPAPTEKTIYFDKSLPSASAKMTDGTGSAIIFNVPVGTLALTARFADGGRAVRSITTLARSKWVTFVQIRLDQAHAKPFDAGP